MKSESISRQPKRLDLVRARTLTRGVDLRPYDNSILKNLWAAYRMGGLSFLKRDIPLEDFELELTAGLSRWTQIGGEITFVFAKNPETDGPVGMVFMTFAGPQARPHLSPKFEWFEWATTRNMVEGTVKFFVEAKKRFLVLFTVEDEVMDFWEHMFRYGIVRGVGKISDYHGRGKHTALWQSVGW